MTRKKMTDEQRFNSRYDVAPGGCWEWRTLNPAGYGTFTVGSKRDGTLWSTGAHRWSYAHFVSPIPDGLTVDHQCRNPACVNPEHLTLKTMRDNLLAGDGPAAHNARKTHCVRGHAFDDENTYVTPDGRRKCRQCQRDGQARREHSAKRLASNARYRKTDKARERQQRWVDEHRDRTRAKWRKWASEHPEQRRAWIEANREKVREYDREWKRAKRQEKKQQQDHVG